MAEDDEGIKQLALRFAEKNPDLLRDMVTSFNMRVECIEFSQGKMIKCGEIKKSYKL